MTTREFVRRVEQQLDLPIKTRTAGRWMVTLLGWFSSEIYEQKEMMYEFEQPFVVDHSKFERAFGAEPTPLDSAIRETSHGTDVSKTNSLPIQSDQAYRKAVNENSHQ